MSAIKTAVFTKNAPAPRAGIYNQAIIANGVIYTSGFTPVDPTTGKLIEGSVGDRTVCHSLVTVFLKHEGKLISLKAAMHCERRRCPRRSRYQHRQRSQSYYLPNEYRGFRCGEQDLCGILGRRKTCQGVS